MKGGTVATMQTISKDTALKFCQTCNWAYESWVTHKLLFDENDNPESNIGKSVAFTNRLSTITQEYCLQQIAKLHDPAIQGNSINLTIDFIERFGEWGERKIDLKAILTRLQDLWQHLRPARNKALSHNDLEALMDGAPLGEFPEGLDVEYFDALQSLVNIVHEKWIGEPYPFNDLAEVDAKDFLALLDRA